VTNGATPGLVCTPWNSISAAQAVLTRAVLVRMRATRRWASVALMLGCGSNDGEAGPRGPIPGDTRPCGAQGIQNFDGSLWGECQEPTPPEPVSPPLICEPGSILPCQGGEQTCLGDGAGYSECIMNSQEPSAAPTEPEPAAEPEPPPVPITPETPTLSN
jgi:hypothetical protein